MKLASNVKDVFMRKDRIAVALTKDLIKTLDEESRKARRSRSDYVQIILEKHLNQPPSPKMKEEEIAIKMG